MFIVQVLWELDTALQLVGASSRWPRTTVREIVTFYAWLCSGHDREKLSKEKSTFFPNVYQSFSLFGVVVIAKHGFLADFFAFHWSGHCRTQVVPTSFVGRKWTKITFPGWAPPVPSKYTHSHYYYTMSQVTWPDIWHLTWLDLILTQHYWILYLFEIVLTKLLWPGSSPHPPPASSWAPRLHLDHLLPHNLLLLAVTFG